MANKIPRELRDYFSAQGKKGGKIGGKKGGLTRAANLTPEQRSAIAKKAAATRWKAAKKTVKKK